VIVPRLSRRFIAIRKRNGGDAKKTAETLRRGKKNDEHGLGECGGRLRVHPLWYLEGHVARTRDRSREESRRESSASAPIEESRDHPRVDRSRISGTRVNREENMTASDSSRLRRGNRIADAPRSAALARAREKEKDMPARIGFRTPISNLHVHFGSARGNGNSPPHISRPFLLLIPRDGSENRYARVDVREIVSATGRAATFHPIRRFL